MFCADIFIKILNLWLSYRLMKTVKNRMIGTPWWKKTLKPKPKPRYKLLSAAISINNITKITNQYILLHLRPSQQKTLKLKNLRPKEQNYCQILSIPIILSTLKGFERRKKKTDTIKIVFKTKKVKKTLSQLLESM